MHILTDIHAHTIASTHAYSTVHDYFAAAKENGLLLFGISDHGPEMPDSPHPWHFGNIGVIPRVIDGVAMIRGIEANILNDAGEVDISPMLEPYLDYAIASFHEPVFKPADKATNTRAAINAIQGGCCQFLGHPGNPNFPLDYEEVIRAAKDNNVVLEINNSSLTHSRIGSLPNCIKIMELVDQLDWKVCFNSDAHISYQIGHLEACVEQANAIGFPEQRVVNATPERLLDFLTEHNKSVKSELSDWLKLNTQ